MAVNLMTRMAASSAMTGILVIREVVPTPAQLPAPSHQFTTTTGPKMFTVTLTVTDNGGETSTEQFIVSVNNTPPVVNITSPVKNSTYKIAADTIYMRQATVSDNEHSGAQLIL